jgi:sulfonate transport system substrate-binding protein
MTKVRRGRGAVTLAAALLVLACGGQASGPGSGLPQVTIATANNMLHTAEFVGIEKGFFLKHGVRVKLTILQTGAEINKAFQSGTAQFGGGSITAIPTARQAGLDLVMFAPYMNDATTPADDRALAVVARAGSGIQPGNWASFAGKRVGLATGGTGDEFLSRLLARNGVDRSKVTFLNVDPGDQLAAIQGGDVDAISTWEPYQTLILDRMGSRAFLVQRDGGALGYILGLTTTGSYLKAHPKTVQDMADAMAETEAWIRANPDQAAVVDTHFIPGLDVATAQRAIKNLDFDPRVDGCTYQAFDDSTRLLVDQHKLKTQIPARQQVTAQLVTRAERSEPQFFRDLKPIPAACSA